jgi:hypothetical protein
MHVYVPAVGQFLDWLCVVEFAILFVIFVVVFIQAVWPVRISKLCILKEVIRSLGLEVYGCLAVDDTGLLRGWIAK